MGRTLNRAAPDEFMQVLQALPEKDGVRTFPDKGWLQEQGAKAGKTPQWGAAMLASMEERGRLQRIRQGRAITGVVLLGKPADPPQAATPTVAEPQPEQETQPEPGTGASLHDRLVALLQRNADEHGKVRLSTDDMRRKLNVPIHDVIKELYNVKKAGDLAFRESRSGKSMNLLAFRLQGSLTPRTAPVDNALAPWSICPDCYWDRRYHRRGDDGKTLICPEPPKAGSPRADAAAAQPVVERKPVGTPVRSRSSGNIGHRAPERKVRPSPVTTWYECHETVYGVGVTGAQPCGQRFGDAVALKMHKDAKHSGEPLPTNVRAQVPAPEPQATESAQAVTEPASGDVAFRPPLGTGTWADYPLLTEAAAAYSARAQAEAALRRVGDNNLADSVKARMHPWAEEVTRLLAALGYEGATDDKA